LLREKVNLSSVTLGSSISSLRELPTYNSKALIYYHVRVDLTNSRNSYCAYYFPIPPSPGLPSPLFCAMLNMKSEIGTLVNWPPVGQTGGTGRMGK
jgi:hypothetical protein